MKIVINIHRELYPGGQASKSFARAVADLHQQNHQILLVCDDRQSIRPAPRPATERLSPEGASPEVSVRDQLLAHLLMAGVPAIGLSGADANLIRLRKKPDSDADGADRMEVAAVNPRWMNLISRMGGVILLSNLALDWSGNFHYLQADSFASAVAIAWGADTLIYLGHANAENLSESLRWLDAIRISEEVNGQRSVPSINSVVVAAREALQAGVARVRILPALAAASLSSFYSAKTECGTEVVLTA